MLGWFNILLHFYIVVFIYYFACLMHFAKLKALVTTKIIDDTIEINGNYTSIC